MDCIPDLAGEPWAEWHGVGRRSPGLQQWLLLRDLIAIAPSAQGSEGGSVTWLGELPSLPACQEANTQPAFLNRALGECSPAPAPPLCSPRKQKMPAQHKHASFHSLSFLPQLSEKIVKSRRKNVPYCPPSEANTQLLFSFVKKNGPLGCCRRTSNSFCQLH